MKLMVLDPPDMREPMRTRREQRLRSGPAKRAQDHVDELDEREWQQNPAQAVDQQVTTQQGCRAKRPILHTPFNASGIRTTMISALKITADRMADDGDVRCITSRTRSCGYVEAKAAGMMAKYLATSFADRERRQGSARHQHLLADLDNLDQLGRIRIEVDHVAGFLRRLRTGIHRHRHVSLGKRRRVVGTRRPSWQPAVLPTGSCEWSPASLPASLPRGSRQRPLPPRWPLPSSDCRPSPSRS